MDQQQSESHTNCQFVTFGEPTKCAADQRTAPPPVTVLVYDHQRRWKCPSQQADNGGEAYSTESY